MGLPVFAANSLLDTDTVTCSPAEASTNPKTRLYDDRSFTTFKTTSAATTVDIITDAGVGNTSDVDYLCILRHDLYAPSGSGAAVTWTFAHSTDNVTYNTIATDTAANNRIIFRKFSSSYTYRYFRLRMTRGASFIPSIGQLQWGTALEFPYGIETDFDPNQETQEGQLNRSQTGNILGAIRIHSERENRIKIPLVLDTFVRDTNLGGFAEFWENHGKLLKPFVFAWNPGNPGSYEQDAYWAIVKPTFDLRRPLATQLDSGYRHIELTVEGESEP